LLTTLNLLQTEITEWPYVPKKNHDTLRPSKEREKVKKIQGFAQIIR